MREDPMSILRSGVLAAACVAAGWAPALSQQKAYGPGVSDTEIKIGQTMPYSGPVSAFAAFGKVQAAYFDMINQGGGIRGRKIKFLSLDDGFSPPKTVEMTRRLVENEQVLFVFGSAGTATNTAVHRYLNGRKVPQLFIGSGATKWGDHKNFPWSMGWALSYQTEARIYARYILANVKEPKIGVLYQNDDFGKDLIAGLRSGLGDKAAALIVKEVSHEVTDATVDSQIIALQASGANVFLNATTPKFAAQAIRKAHDIGWKPTQFVAFISNSIGAVLKPAGLDKSTGIITVQFLKDHSDPRWADDKGMQEYVAFLKKHYAEADPNDFIVAYGYSVAQTVVHLLRQCEDDLTRENVMRQAANLKDLELPLMLPGIKINTAPDNYYPIRHAQMSRFDGTTWRVFGDVIGE
jgi:branched-chain amino acid transport system substrate-binding protein